MAASQLRLGFLPARPPGTPIGHWPLSRPDRATIPSSTSQRLAISNSRAGLSPPMNRERITHTGPDAASKPNRVVSSSRSACNRRSRSAGHQQRDALEPLRLSGLGPGADAQLGRHVLMAADLPNAASFLPGRTSTNGTTRPSRRDVASNAHPRSIRPSGPVED